jgi:predicted nucleotidyltransferase
MRLSTAQRLALKQRFSDELGSDCEIRIFGSRANDAARGGDLDLLVQCPRRLERKVWLAARLAVSAEKLLGGRRVDVLLVDPETSLQPVHHAALRDGIAL